MNNIKFIDYRPVDGQNYLGIATVLIEDKIYLRYRLVLNKKTGGKFLSPASLKVNETTYTESFALDSRILDEKIKEIIMQHVPSVNGHIPSETDDFSEVPF